MVSLSEASSSQHFAPSAPLAPAPPLAPPPPCLIHARNKRPREQDDDEPKSCQAQLRAIDTDLARFVGKPYPENVGTISITVSAEAYAWARELWSDDRHYVLDALERLPGLPT